MKKLILFLLLVVSISACNNDETVYRVDSTLDEYLQRFITEGNQRGKTWNLEKSGLIMSFGDLEDNVAGRCYYEDPIRIVFDTEYWNNIKGSENADELYEDLVFHELGHGLLLRGHKNDYLANGDWASIMCGGDEKDNRSWNINYRSIRRQYYLDELFNQYTAAPYWATKTTSSSLSTDTLLVQDDFNSSSIFWPTTFKEVEYTASYNNGIYTFHNNSNHSTILPRSASVNTSSDFYIEARIKLNAPKSDDQCGLIFGTINTPIYVDYFTINNNARMFMGNTNCYGWFTELLQANLNKNDYNTIGLRKIGSELYYFINGTCVYYDNINASDTGNIFGFETTANSTLAIDYLYIYGNKTNLRNASIFNNTTAKSPVSIDKPASIWKK